MYNNISKNIRQSCSGTIWTTCCFWQWSVTDAYEEIHTAGQRRCSGLLLLLSSFWQRELWGISWPAGVSSFLFNSSWVAFLPLLLQHPMTICNTGWSNIIDVGDYLLFWRVCLIITLVDSKFLGSKK